MSFAGRFGVRGHFVQILLQEHPQQNISSARQIFDRQRVKGTFKDLEPSPEEAQIRLKLARTLKLWETGFQFSRIPLFRSLCHRCSRMQWTAPYNRPWGRTAITEPLLIDEEVPLFSHYDREHMPLETEPNADGIFVTCNTCAAGPSLLNEYRLTLPDVIGPLDGSIDVLANLTVVEKSQVALCALFSKITKHRSKVLGVYEHREGEVNAGHKRDDMYVIITAVLLFSKFLRQTIILFVLVFGMNYITLISAIIFFQVL